MSGVQTRLYCPDQPHLVPQPYTLGSILKPQCLSGLYCRCIQPCCLLVLTCKLVCSFGLNLKLTLHLALVCLMITKLSPELVSHQSIPAWVCCTAPHQSWHCLAYVLGYQLVFPHGAALVTAWQPEQTLQSKTVVKTALNTSAFSISFPLSHHLFWQQDKIFFLGGLFYSWRISKHPSFWPSPPLLVSTSVKVFPISPCDISVVLFGGLQKRRFWELSSSAEGDIWLPLSIAFSLWHCFRHRLGTTGPGRHTPQQTCFHIFCCHVCSLSTNEHLQVAKSVARSHEPPVSITSLQYLIW